MRARENLEKSKVFQALPKFVLAPDEIETIESPEGFREDLLRQIADAKSRIWISALYIENDESGRQILAALRKAKNDNPKLKIKVFVDFHRNQRPRVGEKDPAAIETFRDANFEIIGVPVAASEAGGVLHTKGMVFDNKLIYSGASCNDVYLHGKDKYRVDRYRKFNNKALADAFVQYLKKVFLESEAAEDFTNGAVEIRKENRAKIEALRLKLREANFSAGNTPAEIRKAETYAVPIAGFGKGNPLNKTIVDLINAAEKNITIYTPYFNISKDVRTAIAAALNKGIQVNIVVGDKEANDFYNSEKKIVEIRQKKLARREKRMMFAFDGLPYCYEHNLKKFMGDFRGEIDKNLLNIHLWQDGENTFHPKGVVIDDGEISLITGHNMNRRGDKKDPENGIVIVSDDASVKAQAVAEKDRFLEQTKPLTSPDGLPRITDYPLRQLVAMGIASLFKNRF
ncbi:MAG: CDP-diacylglycerol--serine O-phosphatidyltransferase [Patescibacteria group bacterium]